MGISLVLFFHYKILQELQILSLWVLTTSLQRDTKMKLFSSLTLWQSNFGWSIDLLWRNTHYRIHGLILSGFFKQQPARPPPHFVSLSELIYYYKCSHFSYDIMTKSTVCFWFYSWLLHATLLQKEYTFLVGFKENHRFKVWIYFKILFDHPLIFKGQARNIIQYSLYTFHFCKVSEKEKVIKLKWEESIENMEEPEET